MNIERRGVPVRRRKLQPKPGSARHALIELVPITTPVVHGATTARYVLEVGGARVEFGDDVSVETLRRVL